MNENENISESISPEAEEKLSDTQVTSHTSSMWKYVPIPEDSPERYPESDASSDGDEETGIDIIAARVRGKKHKHDGTNCDDWYEIATEAGMAFAAVSDGAGSKIFSRIGAKTACQTAVMAMMKDFPDFFSENPTALSAAARDISSPEFNDVCTKLALIIQGAAAKAADAVRNEAEKRRTDEALINAAGREPVLSDFSATLLLTAVIPVIAEGSGMRENLVISVQIGDGMTAVIDAGAPFSSALSLMGNPDKGEYSGETEFITSDAVMKKENIMSRTRLRRGRCTDILLMSDGVADDYFPNNPGILRLYLDLEANGIIDSGRKNVITDENRPYVSLIPRPEKYPWVNDSDVSYEFQYMISVMEKTGLSLEQLWDMPDTVAAASLEAFGIGPCDEDPPALRLETWLDNYVRRGSFDDRTLVIIHTDNEQA